ncbi:MAG: hypothetical protein D6701_12525, partial [Gemmatimonadetes bacterium]
MHARVRQLCLQSGRWDADAWGHPIMFFLWPIAYRSPLQPMRKGSGGRLIPAESGNPYDPAGTLTEPAYIASPSRVVFEQCYHPVTFPPGSNQP